MSRRRSGRGVVRVGVAVVLGAWLAQAAGAQDTTTVREGQRVRVTVWSTPLLSQAVGTLAVITADSIVLRPPEGPAQVVAMDHILRVERSVRPPRPGGGRDGFLIGAGIGVLVVKGVLDAIYLNDEFNLLGGVFIGFPLGGVLGTIVGSERAREQWAPARLDARRR